MMTFDNQSLEYFNQLDEEKWYEVLDKIFNHEKLPTQIAYTHEYISDYFLELNNTIVQSNDYRLLNRLHVMLVQYYFDLPTEESYFSRIYTLQWVIGNIKPRHENVKKFFNQFFLGTFNGLFYKGIHLHSSLLSLILELPSIYDNSNMTPYLFKSIDQIHDYSFFRVALRFLMEKKSIDDYWDYFYRISHKYTNAVFADVLTESLMDVRSYTGSFQEVYKKIKELDDSYRKRFPELFRLIKDKLETTYLNPDGKWYQSDIYAQSLKAFFNAYTNAPPPPLIMRAWNQFEENNKIEYLSSLFIYKDKWWYSLGIYHNEIIFLPNKTVTDNLLESIEYIHSKEAIDNENISYYKTVYRLEKEDLRVTIKNDPEYKLQNFIFEQFVKEDKILKKIKEKGFSAA